MAEVRVSFTQEREAKKRISAKHAHLYTSVDMLNIETCKKTLNKGIKKYTVEEIKQIREYLYLLAGMQLELYKQ